MRIAPLLLPAGLLLPGTLPAQSVPLTAGVTVARVQRGMDLYHGKGACTACHGELALGSAEGPALVNGTWKLGSGSFEWLVHITRHAGWGARSRDDDPQPMRGPTVLDPEEIAAVAAYIWSVSRGRRPPTSDP